MNTETEKTVFGADGHPDENQLLLALERELSLEETAEVEQHLGNCWSCRARSSGANTAHSNDCVLFRSHSAH